MTNTFSPPEIPSSHEGQEARNGAPQAPAFQSSGEAFQEKLGKFRIAVATALSAAAITLAPSPTSAQNVPATSVSTSAEATTEAVDPNRDIFLSPNITLKQSEFTPEMHQQLVDIYAHYFGSELKAIGFDLAAALKAAFPPQSPAAGFAYQKIIARAQNRPMTNFVNYDSQDVVVTGYTITTFPNIPKYPQFDGKIKEGTPNTQTRQEIAQQIAKDLNIPYPTPSDIDLVKNHLKHSGVLVEAISSGLTQKSLQDGTALRDIQGNPEVQKAHSDYTNTLSGYASISTNIQSIHEANRKNNVAIFKNRKAQEEELEASLRAVNELNETTKVALKIADQRLQAADQRLQAADQRLQAADQRLQAADQRLQETTQKVLANAVNSIQHLMTSWMRQNPPAPFNTTDVEAFLKININDLPTKRLQDAYYQFSSDIKTHIGIAQIKDFSVFRNPSASNGAPSVKVSSL